MEIVGIAAATILAWVAIALALAELCIIVVQTVKYYWRKWHDS